MVASSNGGHDSLLYNIKVSSVGPGKVTGQDVTYEPSEMDLTMKLHYLNCVYYFPSQAFEGLTVLNFREHTFSWLDDFNFTSGRFRRAETGRPYIKCNDCGMRFIEAECGKTMEEWFEMVKDDASLENMLVRRQVIGPEMAFSPPNLLQAKMKGPFSAFETISAVIWQCIAKIRDTDGLNVVTMIKQDSNNKGNCVMGNNQIISVVKAEFSIVEADLTELAMLMKNGGVDEREKIELAMKDDHCVSDFVVYGAKFTFMDLDDAERLYRFKIQGNKPILVIYGVDGVGEEGAVFVLPGEKNGELEGNGGNIVKAILPEAQIMGLKSELKKYGVLI